MLADEQIRGGVVQGLGAALYEECLYDERGQLLNGSLADYLVPMAGEMPDIEVGHVEHRQRIRSSARKGRARRARGRVSRRDERRERCAGAAPGELITQMPITPTVVLKALGKVP